ncbi:MAG: toll/interleukin-1 receptor domain-containing protein [Ktedonobacterales bacterium]|nr:toll/interleukin-1 receptor domain-containing protein [Ktedonobacterales bacterium]
MATMQIFVSHSHADNAFCQAIVAALRSADADVWYDEHNLGSGQMLDVIQRELKSRPIFILVLSPAAMQSAWVKDEARWAYNLYKRDVTRTILPVTAGTIQPSDFDEWLFIEDYKRIEAPGLQPFSATEAARRLLRTLALTPRGEVPAPTAPQVQESADDLLARGKALAGQQHYNAALPLFERATQLAAHSFEAWYNLGYTLSELHRWSAALAANEQAIALNPRHSAAWNNKGFSLSFAKRYQEALGAYETAISLDADDATSWYNMGFVLYELRRYPEALAAFEHALARNPEMTAAWLSKATILRMLGRADEAQQAQTRANASGDQA